MRKKASPSVRPSDVGFTIIEVLIALTASLLLMLGLTRAYKLIGDQVTQSQAELELSSVLRDVAMRIRDELQRATVDPNPETEQQTGDGYLVYHEGPFTHATTILGDGFDPAQPEYFPTSRFGDFDDYLAFTVQAKENSPFAGFIPWGVLEAHRARSAGTSWVAPPGFDPTLLVPFYSDLAEIAYWAAPRWARVKTLGTQDGTIDYEANSGYPLVPDVDGNLLPDRMDLHRRVLLIRPDLNMTPAEMNISNLNRGVPTFTPDVLTVGVFTLPFMRRTNQGWIILPLTLRGGNEPFFAGSSAIIAPGNWAANTTTFSPNWLAGVARMQQVMDLSISRAPDSWSVPRTDASDTTATSYGVPSPIVRANSLPELTSPDNRFGHVRVPGPLINGGAGTSMPQLALSPPHPYLINRENIFPAQANHNATPPAGPFPYGRFTLVSNLRPEFSLADRVTDARSGVGTPITASVNRGGSDVIAEDILGFDIKIFDETAPKYVWLGLDQSSGTPNNDDQDGNTGFDVDELGLPGTDDEIVTMSDLRLTEVLLDDDGRGTTGPFRLVDRGDFVDLNYTRLPGGAMRGLRHYNGTTYRPIPPARRNQLASPFSGIEVEPTAGTDGVIFPKSWQQSGRFVLSFGASDTLSSFYQPTYDTWTNAFDRDAFDQEGISTPSGGFPFGAVNGSIRENGLQPLLLPNNPAAPSNTITTPVSYRQWSLIQGGLANEGEFVGQDSGLQTMGGLATLAPSTLPIRAVAPVQAKLKALQVTIRLFDVSAEQIRQQTVVEDF
ncbi:PulJ/GspJ family protein [Stieleria varia]|uniref:Uncharacterized protein n=1 Tax=Stieleria varia TaxID=2528005 RepID=A0A5C6B6Y2_9BACT|nr:hypothetical protein [Stieleria varia]TWU07650.1 hypothetical protein Pla52n_02230 [Stieleria varia]